MKKTSIISVFILTAGIVLSSFINKPADAPEWKFDSGHSSFGFIASHLGTPFIGTFNKVDATMKFDPANLEGSSITFTVDAASVDTRIDKRDEHLKSADYFDAGKYPAWTFKSEKITKKSDKEFIVAGSFTAKDVTKKIEIPMAITTNTMHPYNKEKLLLGVKVVTTIKRTEYKIGPAETTGVGDDVEVMFFGEFTKAK